MAGHLKEAAGGNGDAASGFLDLPGCQPIIASGCVREDHHESTLGFVSRGSDSNRMFCPQCKAEYREGFTRCSDCDVPLVASMGKEQEADDPPETVWRGGDPIALSRVVSLLREAGITHNVLPTWQHLVFEFAMPRPFYEVKVLRSQLATAAALVGDIPDSHGLGLSRSQQVSSDQIKTASDTGAGTATEIQVDAEGQQPTVEIWAGNDPDFLDSLLQCLRANEIPCRALEEQTGRLRMLVVPSQESRAREILRQILEGTPPS